jgi:large subunit ribosomal protein L10
MPQEYKVKAVEELKEILKGSSTFFLTDYRGLSVEQITGLRVKLREANASFKVVKNNYFKIALKDAGVDGLEDYLKGPIGVAFVGSDDMVTPAKIVVDYAKALKKEDKFKVIGGYFEGKAINDKEVVQVSALPTKEVLLGQIMSCLQGPVRGTMTCLQGSLRGVMQCLKGLIEKNS